MVWFCPALMVRRFAPFGFNNTSFLPVPVSRNPTNCEVVSSSTAKPTERRQSQLIRTAERFAPPYELGPDAPLTDSVGASLHESPTRTDRRRHAILFIDKRGVCLWSNKRVRRRLVTFCESSPVCVVGCRALALSGLVCLRVWKGRSPVRFVSAKK